MLAAQREHEEEAANYSADNVKPSALIQVNQPVMSPPSTVATVATEQGKSIPFSTVAEQTLEATPAPSNSSTEDGASIAVSANKKLRVSYVY